MCVRVCTHACARVHMQKSTSKHACLHASVCEFILLSINTHLLFTCTAVSTALIEI